MSVTLLKEHHIRFFKWVLGVNPSELLAHDTQRMIFLFFSISGLDLLGGLDDILCSQRKTEIIDWIYSLQILPSCDYPDAGGVRGSPTYALSPVEHGDSGKPIGRSACHEHYTDNLAVAYAALSTLLILGDDFGRVNRAAFAKMVKQYSKDDGSFYGCPGGGDTDLRFVYSACCVCYLLNDWSGMDPTKTADFIRQCLRYDGGMAQSPGNESQGGSTFCGLASLELIRAAKQSMSVEGKVLMSNGCDSPAAEEELLAPGLVERTALWLLRRQKISSLSREDKGGFCGRPEKAADTCYTFWVGSALKLLGHLDFVDKNACIDFVISCQDNLTGGISKFPGGGPDPLHTYLGLAGLSLLGFPDLQPLHPALNVSMRAFKRLREIHEQRL